MNAVIKPNDVGRCEVVVFGPACYEFVMSSCLILIA